MDKFSRLLKSIGVNSNIQEVTATIKQLKTLADTDKPISAADLADLVSNLESQVALLTRDLNDTADTLERFQEEVDAELPSMKQVIQTAIYDYKTAYDATCIYDLTYFKALVMSNPAKVDLAAFLYQLILPFCVSNVETLKQIAEQNPVMLAIIAKPPNVY